MKNQTRAFLIGVCTALIASIVPALTASPAHAAIASPSPGCTQMNSNEYDRNYTVIMPLSAPGFSFATGEQLIVRVDTPSSGTSLVTQLQVFGSTTTTLSGGVPGAFSYTLTEDLDVTGEGVSWGITSGTGSPLNATWTVECIAAPTLTPTFGSIIRTADGYTTQVDNYDPAFTWSTSSTSGSSTISESGLVTVTGLSPSTSATVTVSTARFGYSAGSASATGDALAAGTIPAFDTPVSTSDGFTVNIVNWNPHLTWTVSTSAGTANITSGSIVTVSGLSAGQSATVTVSTSQAGSVDGQADVTDSANPGAPGAPTNIRVSGGDTEATVSWLAPASNGGRAILDYTVTADPGGQGCTTPDGSTTTCVVTGLTNGISYAFTVTARNTLGVGSASSVSDPITPGVTPSPQPPARDSSVGSENPVPASAPLEAPHSSPAKEVEVAPSPNTGSTQPIAKNFTIRFANSSAKLSAQSKKLLKRIAKESQNAEEAITFASARLTPKGATSANRILADQRTTRVCSYLRSAKLKGSCDSKTWVLKPGKPGIGPAVVVRMTLTPR